MSREQVLLAAKSLGVSVLATLGGKGALLVTKADGSHRKSVVDQLWMFKHGEFLNKSCLFVF